MGSYDINSRRGVFRSGELNTESAIPSLGGMPDVGTSELRSETAMRGAATIIVEIGGQFDTQHLLEPVRANPNLRQVTAAGNSLREKKEQQGSTQPTQKKAEGLLRQGMMVYLSCLAVVNPLSRAPRPRVLGRDPWGVALQAPFMAEIWHARSQSGAQPKDNLEPLVGVQYPACGATGGGFPIAGCDGYAGTAQRGSNQCYAGGVPLSQ